MGLGRRCYCCLMARIESKSGGMHFRRLINKGLNKVRAPAEGPLIESHLLDEEKREGVRRGLTGN